MARGYEATAENHLCEQDRTTGYYYTQAAMSNRKGTGKAVNRTELAEFFGVAMPTIDHWVRTGCPSVERGGKGKAWVFNTADVAAWREQKIRDEARGVSELGYEELTRRRLAAQTAREELALAKELEEVAPVWQMEKAMQSAFAEVRAAMRNVPSRAVRQLVGETDEARFKAVLLDEVDQALVALSQSSLVDVAELEPDDDGEDE